MKTKLIQTKHYLLLIDEEDEIKEGKTFITKDNIIHSNYGYNYGDRVVIAYYPLTKEAEELHLPLLPNPFKEVDFDNTSELKILLEKRAEESNTCDLNEYALGLLAGYNAAQSKQLELLKRAIQLASDAENIEEVEREIIQSLSQQLPVSFEPEYESDFNSCYCTRDICNGNNCPKKLKTIINSEGKEEIQGTYKY